MKKFIVLAIALLLVNLTVRLHAQMSAGALVVQTCGTLGQQFSVGSTRQLTVDTTGVVCQ